MTGRIHSIESCGTLDGPGLRCVVFFQGCPLRCRYCHNPDTWDISGGQEVTASEIIKKIIRFKPYFNHKGGVTLSGGEPLLQPEFAAEILRECKRNGIHTAVDTSGWVNTQALEQTLPYTDLLLLDVKALDNKMYQWLTGKEEDKFLSALTIIKKYKKPLWLRYVILPGINDTPEHMSKLKLLASSMGSMVQKIELLPYHSLGEHKWQRLGYKYTLSQVKPPKDCEIDLMYQKFGLNSPVMNYS
jgi:pyruvate formate lyase activating enzyme